MRDERTLNLTEQALKIILHAGDGKLLTKEALKYLENGESMQAEKKLDQAQESLRIARGTQMDVIQMETNGQKVPHLHLFAHAQDILMTATSEWTMATHIAVLVNKEDT
ncbi:PTS lactose/cellobiose transporter subunit IIA [Carnobacterium maltaromaticum]|uniref:PTS lactose/cellobiose transporter subunit IIA n=1 Tax=Carnobacterium maltaromaticum TaxID=2751 RepID=UPI00295F3356|nr:PTS lactose/cellobiose transporter subunit IIA [Carnobacterium maltaromaticum]